MSPCPHCPCVDCARARVEGEGRQRAEAARAVQAAERETVTAGRLASWYLDADAAERETAKVTAATVELRSSGPVARFCHHGFDGAACPECARGTAELQERTALAYAEGVAWPREWSR